MLEKIILNNFKSFQALELKLNSPMVVVGAVNSGKTNFIEALIFVKNLILNNNLSQAFSCIRGDILDSFNLNGLPEPICKYSFTVFVLLSSLTRQKIEEDILNKTRDWENRPEKGKIITEDFLKYEVELEYFPDNRTFRISDERLSALRKDGKEKKSRLPFIEKDKEGKVFHLREEYPGHPFYYEVGRDHTLVSLPLFEPDFPHISALKMEMERIIISRENSSYNVVQLESRIIELAGNELLFKDFVSGLSGLFPEVKGLRIEKDNSESKLIIQFNNFDLNLQSVSRGIINLIYILLLIFENHSSILILDEPEIGLDFEVLPRLAEFIRWFVKKWGNQMIIATKSPQFAEIFSDDEIVIINNSGRGSEITAMPLAGPLFRREEIIKLIRKQV